MKSFMELVVRRMGYGSAVFGLAAFALVAVLVLEAVPVRAVDPDPVAEQLEGEGFDVFLPAVFNGFHQPSVFGVEETNVQPGPLLTKTQEMGAYWMRQNGLLWSLVEPVNGGGYDWSSMEWLESELRTARNAGMENILVVRSTPGWAQKVPGKLCGPMKQEYFDEFGKFLMAAVNRYSGPPFYVRHFEIWNEPDVDPSLVTSDQIFGCWGDKNDPYYGGRYYGDMLKVVYPMMKGANPTITVLIGGLLLDCDPRNPPAGLNCTPSKYLEGILTAGAKNSFDAVSFHAYDYYNHVADTFGNPNWHSGKYNNEPNGALRPVLIAKAGFIREVLASFGATGKQLFNTESALLCGGNNDPQGQPPCESHDTSPFEIMKLAYVAQSYPAAFAEGLRGNLWFTVTGWRNSGLVNSNGTTRLAYDAYLFSHSVLHDAKFLGAVTGYTKVAGYRFGLIDGTETWVIWATDGGPRVISLPGVPASIQDATGDPVAVNGTTVTLTEEPYYIHFP